MFHKIEDNAVVLFQGDSITDYGRSRENLKDMGVGYAMMVSAWFSSLYPEKNVTFINRGIGGNRTWDLVERWKEDCLDLKPTWVSIFIGINDTWHGYDGGEKTSAEEFEANYRKILTMTKEDLNAKIILCEPFLLPFSEERMKWREDFDPKINVIRKLAREFKAILVSLDSVFSEAVVKKETVFWAEDGIHPTPAGNALIARAWLKAVGIRLD